MSKQVVRKGAQSNRREGLDKRLKSGGLKFKAYKVEANRYTSLEGDCPVPRNEVRFEIIFGELLDGGQLEADPGGNLIDLIFPSEYESHCS